MAILVGSRCRPRRIWLAIATFLLVDLAALSSPYLSSTRVTYRTLTVPGAPTEIDQIERFLVGDGGAEETPK